MGGAVVVADDDDRDVRMKTLENGGGASRLRKGVGAVEDDDVGYVPVDEFEQVVRTRRRLDVESTAQEQEAGHAEETAIARRHEDAKAPKGPYVAEVDACCLHTLPPR